jgi:beta-glucosidase
VPFRFAAKHVQLNSAEHRTLARQTATEGAVLLRNPNKTLPLDLTKLKKLAVIGPNGAVRETSLWSKLPLCLSRACLGKMTDVGFSIV